MLEQKTTVIGGNEYTVTLLPARKGRDVGARLSKILAPVAKEDATLADVLTNLSEGDLAFVCDAFAASTTVLEPGSAKAPQLSAIFDLHFAGRYGDMLNWLRFCVEANFGSFLGELGLKMPELEAKSLPKAA